jgi:hypothetical protein
LKIYDRYVFLLVLISCLVNTFLAFFGQEDLRVYIVINIIGFLILTLIFTPSNPEAKRKFSLLNMIFFSGFLVIIITELTGIFSGN